jgi:hypothetical protein
MAVCRRIEASEEAIGDDNNLNCSIAPRASHGRTQVAIYSQVAPHGTGVVNVNHTDMAMN